MAPGIVYAQDRQRGDDDTFLIRVNGESTLGAGETVDVAIVVNNDMVINGTVKDTLIVLRGTAIVNGVVEGNITVVRGDLDLRAGSIVNDVLLINSDLRRDAAATVTGDIEKRSGDFSLGRGAAVFSIFWWLGMVALGVVTGAVFAWLGRSQLFGAIGTLESRFVSSLLAAIVIWIVLPIVAGLIIFTLVLAPTGLSVLLVLLPVLFLLGFLVIGAWLGSYIVKPVSQGRAIGATVLGVLILALVSLIPFVAVVVALAGMLGSGALVARALERTRSGTPAPELPPAGA
jgi:hypothetical protein